MKYLLKFSWVLLILSIIPLAIIGCRGGDTGSTTVVTTNAITGNVNKGPYIIAQLVTAYQLGLNGVRTGVSVTTKTDDNLGHYVFTSIPWSGLTEIEVFGDYLDENTGQIIVGGTVSAITSLSSTTTGVITIAHPNVASSISASIVKQTLSSKIAVDIYSAEAVLQSSNQQTAAALGLNITDINGAAIDLSKLNILQTGDPVLGQTNTQLLALSAMVMDTVTTLTANNISMNQLLTGFATDIRTGQILGSTTNTTAGLAPNTVTNTMQASTINVQNNVANIINNITNVINTANTAPTTTVLTPVPTLTATQLTSVVTNVASNANTVLRGFTVANNQFTVGSVTYSVNSNGIATAGLGTILANNVVFGFNFKDYSNLTGNGIGQATTMPITLSFSIVSTGDSRQVSGNLFPVNVITDGLGAVSLTVPANAVINYTGTDVNGLVVTGLATNIAANIIQTNAGIVTINANNLLKTIQNKLRAQTPTFNILQTAGTFNFNIGLGGINIGSENATATGLSSLFPTGTVGGREISGTLVTQ